MKITELFRNKKISLKQICSVELNKKNETLSQFHLVS
jgi:hypothetical protein